MLTDRSIKEIDEIVKGRAEGENIIPLVYLYYGKEGAKYAASQLSVQRTAERSAEAVKRGEMEAIIKREYEA